ncbi:MULTISPECIES: hypothetical protein [unclassified Nonomuraea]|uniref:hypothetical protein n=1 Tax=unclassified Nonomuraea TaxID=2593643 RepID=UPI0033C037B8
MMWIVVAAVLALVGLGMLAWAGVRVSAAARSLNREVAVARAAIESHSAGLRGQGG